MAALKGIGKSKGKGKGKKGKGKKGGWNGGKGFGNYNYNYRSPGKGIGKGLNYFDDDYWNAWGDDQWGAGDGSWNWDGGWPNGGGMGNLTMMLENGERKENKKTDNGNGKQSRVKTGEWDALTNTRRNRDVPTHNKFEALRNEDDNDDDSDDDSETTTDNDNTHTTTTVTAISMATGPTDESD